MRTDMMTATRVEELEATITAGKRIALAVPAVLLLLVAIGPPEFGLAKLVTGWSDTLDGGVHRMHEVAHGMLTLVLVVAATAVLLRPRRSVGAVQQVAITAAGFLFAGALSAHFWPPMAIIPALALLLVVATVVAWDGRAPRSPVNVAALAVAVVGAVPLVWYAVGETALQRAGDPLHAPLHHWTGSAAVAFALVGLAVSAALRFPAWRVNAYSAGLLAVGLGVASLAMPAYASSFGTLGGAVAVAGGLIYLIASEQGARAKPRSHPGRP